MLSVIGVVMWLLSDWFFFKVQSTTAIYTALQPLARHDALPFTAVMAHDAQMAAGGITTSFDCVCVGVSIKHPEQREILRPMIDAVREASTKGMRSEEHTSELQSLMRISYAVFCLKNNNNYHRPHMTTTLTIQIPTTH